MKKIIKIGFMLLPLLGIKIPGSAATATFAGGCFWCMQPPFEALDGVSEVKAGYTGGAEKNPIYDNYAEKGYTEGIQVTYDPLKISYTQLLDVFWRQINPTDPEGQFVDRGPQYRAAIYYHSETQKTLAEKSRRDLEASGRFDKPVVIKILKYSTFYAAEDCHQDFYKKNPSRYKAYRAGAGRDGFLEKIWKAHLSPLQYQVTQNCGTEAPFHNEYWDNKKEGLYVDIVSGEVLFSSRDKFDSGTGWPSFTKPLESTNIIEKRSGLLDPRTEVRSKRGNSHLGHVFPDGPAPTGQRYCMNSAALRFISKENLEKEGYGEYKNIFE